MGVFEYGRCVLAHYSGHVPVYRTAVLLLSLPENANIASVDFYFYQLWDYGIQVLCHVHTCLLKKKKVVYIYRYILANTQGPTTHKQHTIIYVWALVSL